MGNTYGASTVVATCKTGVLTIVVVALAAEVVTDNLNIKVEFRIRSGGIVLEDGDKSRSVFGTDTEVDRSIVTGVLTFDRVPLASL